MNHYKQKRLWIAVGIFSALVVLCCLPAHCTTVTGTIRVQSQPFTGTLQIQLSYPATTGSYLTLPALKTYRVTNGSFGTINVDDNYTLLPRGTYYNVALVDPYGNTISRMPYVITGSTYDIGAAIPLPVTTNNLNFLDLLGLRNVSIQNLTLTNAITIGGVTYGASGVAGAPQINGIRFAQNYQSGSTTCGLTEAEATLPSTGGWVVVPPGPCTLTTQFQITKPIHLVGYGSGGYADSSTFTTYNAQSTLLNGTGTDMILVNAVTGTTLSEVDIEDVMLAGGGGGNCNLIVGGSGTVDLLHLSRIQSVTAGTCGLAVTGNLNRLTADASSFNGNGSYGIEFLSGTIGSVSFLHSSISRNGTEGLLISIPLTATLDASSIDNNGNNGILVAGAATLHLLHSSASTNGTAGVRLLAGTGHTIADSTLLSNGRQQYGVFIQIAAASDTTQATLRGNTISGSTTMDVQVNSPTSYVLYYPETTQTSTISDATNVIHYFQPPHSVVAVTGIFTTCTMVGHSSTDVSCVGTEPWDRTITGSYYAQCMPYQPGFSGGADSTGMTRAVMGVTTMTSTQVTYWTSSLQGGSGGNNEQAYCEAIQ